MSYMISPLCIYPSSVEDTRNVRPIILSGVMIIIEFDKIPNNFSALFLSIKELNIEVDGRYIIGDEHVGVDNNAFGGIS